MPWETYSAIIQQEWETLLARTDSVENDFQEFLERHPCCLPPTQMIFGGGGHGAYPGAIVSQPKLNGFSKKIPDFLCITRDSAAVYAVLVEIEHPSKPWATGNGQSSAEFTQAINQIADWKSWFCDPVNVMSFQRDYRIPADWLRSRSFVQKYVLIYGRRSDPSLTEEFNKKRKLLEREDEFYMTYDRIRPYKDSSQDLCAKLDAIGYRALSVPPTLTLGPIMAHGVNQVRDKAAAVQLNRYLSDVRKKFLIERIPYWDAWDGSGIRSSTDVE
jgi:hypothetical protein